MASATYQHFPSFTAFCRFSSIDIKFPCYKKHDIDSLKKVALTMRPGTNPIYWWKLNWHRVHSPGFVDVFRFLVSARLNDFRVHFLSRFIFHMQDDESLEKFNVSCQTHRCYLFSNVHYIFREQLMETAKSKQQCHVTRQKWKYLR